ncbi:TPA: hypothetical protein HA231_01510 [Candidatus Woesearchaeota archaeon]|nr:hypothetical protein [Candidatus Woesearchaeota archaeon]
MNIWQVIVWKTKFLTRIDDWLRLVTMTMIAFLLAGALGLTGAAFTAIVAVGVAIDVHDVVEKVMEGKPIF